MSFRKTSLFVLIALNEILDTLFKYTKFWPLPLFLKESEKLKAEGGCMMEGQVFLKGETDTFPT